MSDALFFAYCVSFFEMRKPSLHFGTRAYLLEQIPVIFELCV